MQQALRTILSPAAFWDRALTHLFAAPQHRRTLENRQTLLPPPPASCKQHPGACRRPGLLGHSRKAAAHSLPDSCPGSAWIPAPRPAAGASVAPGQNNNKQDWAHADSAATRPEQCPPQNTWKVPPPSFFGLITFFLASSPGSLAP